MRYVLAPVKNMLRLNAAFESLWSRDIGVPGLGLIHGPSGFGKTTAISAMVARQRAAFVRANSTTTLSSLLDAIRHELKVEGRLGKNSEKFSLICEAMLADRRPIFVDEGDYLMRDPRMLEVLRDIHDTVSVPVLLVGMAGIERRLVHRPQFARRISQRVEFQPSDLADARLLADTVCEVAIEDDLLASMHAKSQGSVGLMIVALAQIESMAKANRVKAMNLECWGDRPMFLARGA